MGPTKKNAVTKTASRPCKSVGLPDATMAPSATSTRLSNNGSHGRIMKARSKKSNYVSPYPKADDGDDDDDYEPFDRRSKANCHEGLDSDDEFSTVESSDDEYTGSKNAKSKGSGNFKQRGKPKKDGAFLDPNGRVKGRDLIPWTRPRMIEKLILHLQYEAELAGIKLPWDAAVKRLHPGSKEGAAVQQLAKLRGILLTEGHMVPPKAKVKNKRGIEFKPQIRGYVRPDGAGPYETRVVGWNEKIVDLTKNIENPGIYRGSGRYPRQKNGAVQHAAMNGNGQMKDRTRIDTSTSSNPSLMVTLKLNPKNLAKFPSGTGSTQAVSNQHDNFGGAGCKPVRRREVENDTTERSDIEGNGQGSDEDNADLADQNARLKAIKKEHFDSPGAHADTKEVDEVDGYKLNRTQDWLTGGLAGSEAMHLSSNLTNLYDGERTMSFESGAITSSAQFNTLSGFNLWASQHGDSQLMYPSGALHQYSMYNDPSMISSRSYVSNAVMTTGLASDGEQGQRMGTATQAFPSYSYYQGTNVDRTSFVAATQSSIKISSGGAASEPGYESYSAPSDSADLNDKSSSTKAPEIAAAIDHAAKKSSNSNPLPAHSPSSFGSDRGSDDSDDSDDSYDIDDYLNHDIFDTSY